MDQPRAAIRKLVCMETLHFYQVGLVGQLSEARVPDFEKQRSVIRGW